MTFLDVKRDPVTGHYDILLRMTNADALELARRILAAAEIKAPETPTTPSGDAEAEDRIG